jgi:IclR family transcriptional regulator, acetate operon repressor
MARGDGTGLGPSGALQSVRAVTRTMDVLDVLRLAPEGLPLTEIAERAGLPVPTAMRYLLTMEERRYVERHPMTGSYMLGFGLPKPAGFYERLVAIARPSLERLRREVRENILLSRLDRHRMVFLDYAESPYAVRVVVDVYETDPIHSTAVGKAVAATLPAEVVQELLSSVGMSAETPRTITEPKAFLAELERVRERGYAVSERENTPEASSVAVALPASQLKMALGAVGPAMRFPDEPARVAALLRREADRIVSAIDPGGELVQPQSA